jgi:hypothetical protein
MAGTVKKRPEKELPVIAAPFLYDAHVPYRTKKAAHLVEMGAPPARQLRRPVFLEQGADALVIFFGRVDILQDIHIGLTNREIADKYHVTEMTILAMKHKISSVMVKYGFEQYRKTLKK